MSRWNLHKTLLLAAAASTILAMLTIFGWDLSAFLGGAAQFAPAFPGILLAVALVWYDRPWMYLVAGLATAFMPAVAVFVFGAANALLQPLAGGEHQAVLFLASALLFGLQGGIGGFLRGRKGAHTPLRGALSTPAGAVPAVAAALVAGMLLASGLATSQARAFAATGGFDVEPEVVVTVRMKDFEFHPKEIEIPAGRLVGLVIVNEDQAYHTLSYEVGGKLFEEPVVGAATSRVLLRHAEPQTIKMWCAPHSAGAEDDGTGMVGTIKVV